MRPPETLTPALQELLENVDAERDEFHALGEFDGETLERLRTAFLPERISDTLNIEGIRTNPRVTLAVLDGMTLSETDRYAETEIRNSINAHEEIERLVKAGEPITPAMIKSLNFKIEKDLIASAGEFRTKNVEISGAQVRPPQYQLIESRIVELCKANEFYASLHPIVRAAWIHREFAEIHPFEDGNGRTARLLQDHVMAAAGYLPVGIPAFRRQEYYDVLQQADFGDLEPLVFMIANSELTALTKARRVVKDPKTRVAAIQRILRGRERVASRARELEYDIWHRRVEELVDEANVWAADLNREANGATLMRVKVWDPLALEDWQEIKERGIIRASWIATLHFGEPGKKWFSILLAAKRLDKMPMAIGAGHLGANVGLQCVVADGNSRYHFTGPFDEFIKLRAIGISEQGFDAFTVTTTAIQKERRSAAQVLESLVEQAAVKAGWTI
ncbi:Fic family protein [Micromonospora echinofusca]|uniref:Fic family protein n=1 Tax=Micromonospora echinofusca TaxID=47858 RepID=UPI00340B15BD